MEDYINELNSDDDEVLFETGTTFYLSRHGESTYNLEQRIGGNPDLSERGRMYSKELAKKINSMEVEKLKIWTSELKRANQTVEHIESAERHTFSNFNELDSGSFDHLTYSQFERLHPKQFSMREENKLTYRYPGGESYVDLCRRVKPMIGEMRKSHNLLVVSHQAVLRCVLYFLQKKDNPNLSISDTPYIKVPLHTLIKVTFDGTRHTFDYIPLNIECVDTHRTKIPTTKFEPLNSMAAINKDYINNRYSGSSDSGMSSTEDEGSSPLPQTIPPINGFVRVEAMRAKI